MHFRRDISVDPDAVFAQEVDRVAQLSVVRELDPEGQASRVVAEAELFAEFPGEEADCVMLRVSSEEEIGRASCRERV